MIAGPNFTINEQSEKFWYWINVKVSTGDYGKESDSIENLGEYGWWENWGIFGS